MVGTRKRVTLLVVLAALGCPDRALAQSWGTVKGQVVWGPDTLPEKVKANVDKDQAHCLSKGDIYTDAYVVNPKSRGVRWVLVWLTDPENAARPIPVHPQAKAGLDKKPVVIDQPCCKFEPRMVGLMEG